jgi:hypothetical protein
VEDIVENSPGLQSPTGTPLTRSEIEQVKKHLFENEHLLSNYEGGLARGRFDADPEIAEAWFRLECGEYTQLDELFVNHELTESAYMRLHPEAAYPEAHHAANAVADWYSALQAHNKLGGGNG